MTMTATPTEPTITIQPAARDSLAFVLSNWGREVERRLEATPRRGFLKAFAPIQARLIKRSTVLTAMRGDKIAGFVVHESNDMHWIFVRDDERRKGTGRLLLGAGPGSYPSKTTITFWTSDLRHIGLADAPYTPFWLRS